MVYSGCPHKRSSTSIRVFLSPLPLCSPFDIFLYLMPTVRIIQFSLTLLIFLFPDVLRPSTPLTGEKFKNLTVDHGLSQNSVYAIVQDRRGFMWFGTKDGLNRYDGYSFRIFKHDPADSTSISDNFVTRLYEDTQGRLWVGTQNGGINLYDRTHETFYRVFTHPNAPKGIHSHNINDIAEDHSGNIWFATNGNGLLRISSRANFENTLQESISLSFLSIRREPDNSKTLNSDIVSSLHCDSRGILWIGTRDGGLQLLDVRSTESIEQGFYLHPENKNRNVVEEVQSIIEDRQGNVWLGHRLGVSKFSPTLGSFSYYQLPVYFVRAICEDISGTLWLGTYGQTLLFKQIEGRYIHQPAPFDLQPSVGVIDIYSDRDGGTWFGSNGGGVFYHHPKFNRFASYTAALSDANGWPGYSVRSLFEDTQGRWWVGSYGGLYVSNPSQTKFHRELPIFVRAMTQDSRGVFWLASEWLGEYDPTTKQLTRYLHNSNDSSSIRNNTVSGVLLDRSGTLWVVTEATLSKFNHRRKSFTHYPFGTTLGFIADDPVPVGMYQDHEDNIWLATEQGLFRFNQRTSEFTRYVSEPGRKHGLSYSVTRSICPDPVEPRKFLWIGTAGGGLNRLNLETGEFIAFTEKDGLPNNVVYGVLGDRNGNLWLSTNQGVARFNPRDSSLHTYVQADGLQSNEYNSGAYHKAPSGTMLFGGIQGFDAFVPEGLEGSDFIPQVVVTQLQLFNKPVLIGGPTGVLRQSITETEGITLSYEQNVLSFTFSSLDYTAPEKNLYQYMLEGFDDEFAPPVLDRTATYTNLDPGTYTFRVRGSNSDGVWNEEGASLAVTVLPPFWMTWWFRTLLVVLSLSVGPLVYYRRVTALKKEHARQQEFSRRLIESQESERKRIAGELHDSLGQSILIMKNHALMGLKPKRPGTASTRHFEEISSEASEALDEVRKISHNLRPYNLDRFGLTESLKGLCADIQKAAHFDLHFEVDTVDGAVSKEYEITVYRVIQESFNNIIKYANAATVSVRVRRTADALTAEIIDDGAGFNADDVVSRGRNAGGFGLSGMTERAKIAGGSLEVRSVKGEGTTICLQLPLVS